MDTFQAERAAHAVRGRIATVVQRNMPRRRMTHRTPVRLACAARLSIVRCPARLPLDRAMRSHGGSITTSASLSDAFRPAPSWRIETA